MKKILYDLIIKNGTVLDPANGVNGAFDVAVTDGKIAAIHANLPEGAAHRAADASGCIVTPGLIDMHCHIFPEYPAREGSLPCVDPNTVLFRSGVTTAVDAGTVGWRDLPRFKSDVIDHCPARVLAFLNIASGGMVDMATEQETLEFHPEIVATVANGYADIVVGIKSAHYWVGKPFDERHPPFASVNAAVHAAELCGKRVMLDFQPTLPERTYAKMLLDVLRPGDIHGHMYAQQFPIIDNDGRVYEHCLRARERGVLFDLGHGAGSFWFRNAVPAIAQGFGPDVVSTDLHFANANGPVENLLHVMSKCIACGMTLEDTIFRATKRPAEIIGRPELGDLSVGSCADITIIKAVHGPTGYVDCGRARLDASMKLECIMTVRAGKIVYNPTGLTLHDWRDAPEAYRRPPGILPE